MENDKLLEVLLEELRAMRSDIKALDEKFDNKLNAVERDVSTLKTRFMFVAITMGLAGGKIGTFFPFLK